MAVDSRGAAGEPVFLASGAEDSAADLTELGAYALFRGGLMRGTTAERAAFASSGYAKLGDHWDDTTLGHEFRFNGSAWVRLTQFWSTTGGQNLSTGSRIVATVVSGVPVQSGETVKVNVRGLGVYNALGGTALLNLRYAVGSTPTTSSPVITAGGVHRKLGLTGSVDTMNVSGLLTMPSTGVLHVSAHMDVANVYSDPWSLDIEVAH